MEWSYWARSARCSSWVSLTRTDLCIFGLNILVVAGSFVFFVQHIQNESIKLIVFSSHFDKNYALFTSHFNIKYAVMSKMNVNYLLRNLTLYTATFESMCFHLHHWTYFTWLIHQILLLSTSFYVWAGIQSA